MKNYLTQISNYISSKYERAKGVLRTGAIAGLALLVSGCITFTGENGLCTVATSPFRPNQWKTHPVRTGIVAAVYVGGAAAAAGGGGSGSSGSVEPVSIEPTPAPRNSSRSNPEPNGGGDDGGNDSGGGF